MCQEFIFLTILSIPCRIQAVNYPGPDKYISREHTVISNKLSLTEEKNSMGDPDTVVVVMTRNSKTGCRHSLHSAPVLL